MSTTVVIGGLLALLCAALSDISGFLKYRGANRVAPVVWRHPLRSGRRLFASKPFALGMAAALVAWGLHVAALSLAPMSLVQVALASGMILLAVFGERFFGVEVGGRRWIGLALLSGALALLALSEPAVHGAHSRFSPAALIAFEATLFAVGGGLVASPRLRAYGRGLDGALLGLGAGVLFGVSDTAVKALSGISLAHGPLALVLSPWLAVAIGASVLSFYGSAAALQRGEALSVLALTSTAMNVSGIASGILVFGDPLPSSAVGLLCQSFGFLLLIVASLLLPGVSGRLDDALAAQRL